MSTEVKTPVVRHQKQTSFTLDDETIEMLQKLADQDETQPGNRSNVLRRLIREEYKYKLLYGRGRRGER